MSDGKKKLEIEDEVQQENIYSNFIEKVEVSNPETKDDNINRDDANKINMDTDISTYQYKEKEYKSNTLSENTKITKASKASRAILIGFYLILIVVVALVIFMIRANKYEFYLKEDEVVINTGSSYQVELIPKDIRYFDYSNYDYSVGDENVAIVDEYGTITTLNPGRTTLKISLKPGFTSKTVQIVSSGDIVDNVNIGVYEEDEVKKTNLIDLDVKQSVTMKVIVNNENKVNATAKFVSSNEDVAVVDNFGNVTAKGVGKAVIKGEIDGKEATMVVNVKNVDETKKTTQGNVTKVSLGVANQINKYVGEVLQLSPIVEPSNLKGYAVTWSSSNTSVATIDKDGLIRCKTVGTTYITVEIDGVKASTQLNVRNKSSKTTTTEVPPKGTPFPFSQVKLSNTSLTLNKNKTATFKITVSKATGTLNIVSSDESVVKVTMPSSNTEVPKCGGNKVCYFNGSTKDDVLTFTVTGIKKGKAYIEVIGADIYANNKEIKGTGKIGILVK